MTPKQVTHVIVYQRLLLIALNNHIGLASTEDQHVVKMTNLVKA